MGELQAVLFDLDDTLLGNNMDNFLRSYFPLLAEYVQSKMDRDHFLRELMAGTQAMIQNNDRTKTNRDVFWHVFCGRTGFAQEVMEPFMNGFYSDQFPTLRSTTHRLPTARTVVQYCFDQGYKVVIATNPLFPFQAIKHRLAWAGVPVDVFNYDLVTAYENMHATKPNHAYYQEILDEIGVDSSRTLMVGDDWTNDIIPASNMGLRTFWIVTDSAKPLESNITIDGSGTLESLYNLLISGRMPN